MTNALIPPALLTTVEEYFEMMFDSDPNRFDRVFAASAQLHGLRDGSLRVLSAGEYPRAFGFEPIAEIEGRPTAAGNSAGRFRLFVAGAGQGSRSRRYDFVRGLPVAPLDRWILARHREVVPR